jgi:O-Antigen ligase
MLAILMQTITLACLNFLYCRLRSESATLKYAVFPSRMNYPLLLLAHLFFGVLLYWRIENCKYYSLLIFLIGLGYIVKNKNRNHEVLYAVGYMVGCEVMFRMSYSVSYEFAKYAILVYCPLGLLYSGFSKKALWYVLYLLLLVPSVLLLEDFEQLSKRSVAILMLNTIGPTCLGLLSIYAFDKKISVRSLTNILLCVALPIFSMAVFVFLKSPHTSNIWGVESNHYFSGMFGPNQTATVMGLAMFVFFSRAILNSKSTSIFVLNLAIGSFLCYTGLITFSRAGMITGSCAVIVLAIFVFLNAENFGKWRAKSGLVAFVICLFAVFTLISYQTHGLLVKRYTNRDHLGRTKRDKPYSRRAIATKEVQIFIQNPAMGVGITKAEETRKGTSGKEMHSHDEITRMLAEHGTLGLMGILILILTPAWLFFCQKKNIFLATFFVFWFLTINHSGIRVAAPAFLYALMLLQVDLSSGSFFSQKPERGIGFSKIFSRKPQTSSI